MPFAQVTGSQVIVNGLGGDDQLVVDVSLGDFPDNVLYVGGDGSAYKDMVAAQAPKRVALEFVERRRATWDHRKLGGVY